MKLFAFNINAACCSNGCVARETDFINLDCARAGIFDFFYLISGRFVKPFVGYLVVEDNVPNAFLAVLFFPFAGNDGKDYNGNGTGYSFHVNELKKLIAINIIPARVRISCIARNTGLYNGHRTPARILNLLNLIIRGLIDPPYINRGAAIWGAVFHGLIVTVLSYFLFTGNSG